MRRHATDPLFAWARLQDHPPLSTRRRLLEVLADQDLRDGLERARGQGRDDFPMPVLGGTVVFTVARRHPTCASCLAELGRHAALYRRLGLSSVEDIPHVGNVSRFVEVLGPEPHLTELRRVFDGLAQQ